MLLTLLTLILGHRNSSSSSIPRGLLTAYTMLFRKPRSLGGKRSEPDPSLPINYTPRRERLLKIAIRLCWQWAPTYGCVKIILPGLALKSGHVVRLAEAHALEYITKNTSVPVPRLYMSFEDAKTGKRYMLMSRLKGKLLMDAWSTMSEETRCNVLAELRGYMQQIRALKPPLLGHIGAVDYTHLEDERTWDGRFGPFNSPEEFHLASRVGAIDKSYFPEMGDDLQKVIDQQSSREYPICLTHGDLAFYNIMVKNGKITGIFDWEMAGWCPDYWEYVCTYYSMWKFEYHRPYIAQFLDPYPEELQTELLRRRLFTMW